MLPENQRANERRFFDLLVYPGQEQDLTMRIGNKSEKEIVVLVELITASTSRNGNINYTSRGMMDETLVHSFEDIAELPQSHYTIPAESYINVNIKLTVPDQPFEGVMLGAIRVLREATAEEREAAGAVVNQFAHVTAVRLVQNANAEEMTTPDFALGEISAELINFRASIIAHIRNTEPILIKNASITATVFPRGSEHPIFEYNLVSVDFAPNSIMPYSFVDREGYGIEAGDYTMRIYIEHEGKTWSFEEDFTITPQAATAVNERALNQQGQQRPPTGGTGGGGDPASIPMWVMFAAGGGAMTLVFTIVMLIKSRNANKKVMAALNQINNSTKEEPQT